MEFTLIHQMLLALGLGLLVGMQREWAEKRIAGIRTMPLVCLFGLLAASLGLDNSPWVIAGAVVALAAIIVMGDLARLRDGEGRPGLTTELSILVMFAVGAVLAAGEVALAVAATGATAILLHWKRPLHHFVRHMGEDDVRSVVRLALIGLVILPALPNRTFGPYDVLNPFEIWLVVVLIVGISLAAYVAYRLLGARKGSVLAGLLGGLISSTATTVTYARSAHRRVAGPSAAAFVIVLASAVVFVRVLLEIAVVAPASLPDLAPPLLAMMGWITALCVAAFLLDPPKRPKQVDQSAPSEMKAAVIFGLLYALVLLGVAAAKEHFGRRGLYVVAGLSGLTDMDAITLSTARMLQDGRLETGVAWHMLVLSYLANMVFKGAVVMALGDGALRRRIALWFGLSIAGGALLLWLW